MRGFAEAVAISGKYCIEIVTGINALAMTMRLRTAVIASREAACQSVPKKVIFMSKSLKRLCASGIVAALYAAVTVLSAPFAYGAVQFRLSEALMVLCWFRPWLGVGLTLGCLIANLFSTVTALDMVIGTLATALACLWTARIRRLWLTPLPTVLCNGLLVGAMLALVLTPTAPAEGFGLFFLQVSAGEAAVMYLLGMPLLLFLRKSRTLDRVL